MQKNVSVRQTLDAHTDKSRGHDGCWPWTGKKTASGYGAIGPYNDPAHRIMYEETVGPIPRGEIVCHRCDNRKCVNPAHLFLGTHLINHRDKMAKGRSGVRPRKFNSVEAKVNKQLALEIWQDANTPDDHDLRSI